MKPLQRIIEVTLLLAVVLGCGPDRVLIGPSPRSARHDLALDGLLSRGTWSPVASMPTARFGLAATTGRYGMIYAIGGSTGLGVNTSVGTVEAYDPNTDSWSAVAPMPTARRFLMAATDRYGRIYGIGGGSATGFRNTVERYDPETNSWSTVASLPAPLCCGGAARGPDGRIYVAGGFNALGQFSSMLAYDPDTDTWENVASLPIPLAGGPAAAVTSNGLIYIMGGITGVTTIATAHRYVPCADTWTTAADMPTPRRFADAVSGPGGQVYVLGGTAGSVGFPGTQILTVVERYDPVSDSWATTSPLGTPRGALAAAVGQRGTIFAIGGFDGNNVLSSVEAFTPGSSDFAGRGADAPAEGASIAPRCGEQ